MFERAPVSLFLGSFGGHDAARANRSGAGRRVERLNGNHICTYSRYRRPSQDFLAARSMTKKRLSLMLIMESSRFVIEKKKRYSLCQLRDRARANDAPAARRPHAPTRPLGTAQVSKTLPLRLAEWHTLSTPYPRRLIK